jgi:hypothetical protein
VCLSDGKLCLFDRGKERNLSGGEDGILLLLFFLDFVSFCHGLAMEMGGEENGRVYLLEPRGARAD